MLHIANDAGVQPIPDALRLRLEAKPEPLTPATNKQRDNIHEQLRSINIDSVKERAARDLKRVEDAACRKRQLQESVQSRKVERLAASERKASARKAALVEKLVTDSARRDELAASVHANRHAADLGALRKGLESANRGQQAVERRQKLIDARVWRSNREVKHALDVAQSHKENSELETQLKSEHLAERLGAAEGRRQDALQTSIQFAANHDGRARAFAIARQEQAFTAQLKKAKLTAALTRAAEKRESTIKAIQDAAAFFNEHAAEVAKQVKGTAVAGAEPEKAKLFEKLLTAKVTRSLGLRAKVEQSAAAATVLSARPALSMDIGFHPEVIQIDAPRTAPRTRKAPTPHAMRVTAAPPAALLRRLSMEPRALLATAAARQLAAASRREMIRTAGHTKYVQRIGRVAKAAAVRARARADLLMKLEARDSRLEATGCYKAAMTQHKKAQTQAMVSMVEANRLAIEEERSLAGLKATARSNQACEVRGKTLRTVAKRGVVAVRAGAASGRRKELVHQASTKGLQCSLRCVSAEMRRSVLLATRAALAAKLAGSNRSVHWSGAVSVE